MSSKHKVCNRERSNERGPNYRGSNERGSKERKTSIRRGFGMILTDCLSRIETGVCVKNPISK
jgi:hypothetical protein